MPNPVTDYLEHINHEVSKLSTVGLSRLTEVLDAAEVELSRDLARWSFLGKGADRFTPQMYRSALVQIRGALAHIRGEVAQGLVDTLRHGGVLAAKLATKHLIEEVGKFSTMFEGAARPVAIEAASVLAEGKNLVFKRFASSASRYAGQVGEDIRKQLAIGVIRGETVDQLTTRLTKLGGPQRAESIADGLFRRYRHAAERLVVTETVNAYNSFALTGMDELEKEDPGYFKRWDAAVDRKLCLFCRDYDDQVVALDKSFRGGVKHPPLHPRCRCAVVVWRKEWNETKVKDDLVRETVKHKEPKGIAEAPHRIRDNKKSQVSVPEGFKGEKGKVVVQGVPSRAEIRAKNLYSVPVKDIQDRLIALEGAGKDLVRMQRVKDAWAQGVALPAVKLAILPNGKIFVDDGRHRLLIAMQEGRTVLVKFVKGTKGAEVGTVPLKPPSKVERLLKP